MPPSSVRVWLDYGTGPRATGRSVEAEIRELLTHVPVWDGKPGALQGVPHAQRRSVLRARPHDRPAARAPQYHYRFRYVAGQEIGRTLRCDVHRPHRTRSFEPFTFTAFGDEGIPGPSLDRDPSLLPESDWGMWNNGALRRRGPRQSDGYAE